MSESLANCIKAKAHDLGFHKVGITRAVSTPKEKENLDFRWEKDYSKEQIRDNIKK